MAANIDRSVVSRGPALLIFAFAGIGVFKMISEGDVTANFQTETADQPSAAYGPLATFKTGLKPTVTCKPVGVTTLLPLFNAFADFVPGRSIVGAKVANVWTDNTLIVQPLDTAQQQTTYYGVALSGAPAVTFSAVASLYDGDLTFTVAGKNAVAQTDAHRFYLKANNANVASGYDPATLIRQAYDVNFSVLLPNNGDGVPQYFSTRAGAKFTLGLATDDHVADGALWDVSFKQVAPVVSLAPVGIAEDVLLGALNIQGDGSEIGRKLADTGSRLRVAAPGVTLLVPLAGIRKASLAYGATADRIGDLEFVGSPSVGGDGTVAARFYVGTADPED